MFPFLLIAALLAAASPAVMDDQARLHAQSSTGAASSSNACMAGLHTGLLGQPLPTELPEGVEAKPVGAVGKADPAPTMLHTTAAGIVVAVACSSSGDRP